MDSLPRPAKCASRTGAGCHLARCKLTLALDVRLTSLDNLLRIRVHIRREIGRRELVDINLARRAHIANLTNRLHTLCRRQLRRLHRGVLEIRQPVRRLLGGAQSLLRLLIHVAHARRHCCRRRRCRGSRSRCSRPEHRCRRNLRRGGCNRRRSRRRGGRRFR